MSVYKKSKKMVKEKEPFLNAIEEYDRSKKLRKASHKERANFTIEADLMIKFRQYCKKNGISMSHKVEFWIRKFMKDKGEKHHR